MTKEQCFALVTGASSGIGRALCYLLADQGINLIMVGRDDGRLQQLHTELQSKVIAIPLPADLATKSGRALVIEKLHEYAPAYVINNAGFGLYGDCLTHTTDEQLNVLEVNAASVLELTLEAARSLYSKGKKGTILNLASLAALYVYPSLAVYSASKLFVSHFSQSFDEEMREYGIRILACCPGTVETKFSQRAGEASSGNKKKGKMTPEFVASEIWHQIQKGESLRVIDWKYRLMTWISRFFPRKWVSSRLRQHVLEQIEPRQYIKIKNE